MALGKVEVERRKGNAIPDGWAVDSKGCPTNDPEECWNGGGLMPLGQVAKIESRTRFKSIFKDNQL